MEYFGKNLIFNRKNKSPIPWGPHTSGIIYYDLHDSPGIWAVVELGGWGSPDAGLMGIEGEIISPGVSHWEWSCRVVIQDEGVVVPATEIDEDVG